MQVAQIPGVVKDPMGTASGGRRILFYGGCHAGALAQIFRQFNRGREIYFDFITNFEIITNKIKFPYEHIAHWSAVVFSPIAKYAGYETVRLLDACDRAGVQAISYPWLEWRGYFPGTLKQDFLTKPAWQYPDLIDPNKCPATLQDYQIWASTLFSNKSFIVSEMEKTSYHLKNQENSNNCTIRVSDFILENFRNERLFLTPDHPAKALYNFVVEKTATILSVPIDESFYYSKIEPQYGIKLPISPDVTRMLNLKFFDADYQDDQCFFGPKVFTWNNYLKLCHSIATNSVIYTSNMTTFLKRSPKLSTALTENELIQVQRGTVLYTSPAPKSSLDGHTRISINWTENALKLKLKDWDDIYIFSDHWNEISTRSIKIT